MAASRIKLGKIRGRDTSKVVENFSGLAAPVRMESNNTATIRDLRNSVFQWLQSDEAFLEELNRRRMAEEDPRPEPVPQQAAQPIIPVRQQPDNSVRALAEQAAATLRELMSDVQPEVRIKAALAVLEFAGAAAESTVAAKAASAADLHGLGTVSEPAAPSLSSLEAALESSFHATRQARAAARR